MARLASSEIPGSSSHHESAKEIRQENETVTHTMSSDNQMTHPPMPVSRSGHRTDEIKPKNINISIQKSCQTRIEDRESEEGEEQETKKLGQRK